MLSKKATILAVLIFALATAVMSGQDNDTGHTHIDGHSHGDGHSHDKDVHSHDIAYTDHCFSCEHQIYSLPGGNSKPQVLDFFKNFTGQQEDCKTPGESTKSVHCKLSERQVCVFQLTDAFIKSKNDSNESYSVRLLSRRCVNDTYASKKECYSTETGDMFPWVGKSLRDIGYLGYDNSNKTTRICYCNNASDCNDEVVSGATLVNIQGVNFWSCVALAFAFVLLRNSGIRN